MHPIVLLIGVCPAAITLPEAATNILVWAWFVPLVTMPIVFEDRRSAPPSSTASSIASSQNLRPRARSHAVRSSPVLGAVAR